MMTTQSHTLGRIIYINGYSCMIGIETRAGERILVDATKSTAEGLDVVVHLCNGEPVEVQDISSWLRGDK